MLVHGPCSHGSSSRTSEHTVMNTKRGRERVRLEAEEAKKKFGWSDTRTLMQVEVQQSAVLRVSPPLLRLKPKMDAKQRRRVLGCN